MRTFLVLLAVSLAVSPAERATAQGSTPPTATVAPAPPPAAGGSVRSDRMSLEVLPPRAGTEIRTAEGFIRLEGSGAAPAGLASFGTYRSVPLPATVRSAPAAAQAEAAADVALPVGGDNALPPPMGSPANPCRAERSRYFRRLLLMSGIELDDPLAFLEGMAGPGGYPAHYLFTVLGLLPGTEPIPPAGMGPGAPVARAQSHGLRPGERALMALLS